MRNGYEKVKVVKGVPEGWEVKRLERSISGQIIETVLYKPQQNYYGKRKFKGLSIGN